MRNKRALLLSTCSAVVIATSPAYSQVFGDEIVVTAEKREESVQDVGISVKAVGGDQLEALGFTNAQQVTSLAAGVSTIQPNGEANYSVTIRGVANSDYTTNVESPVAIYVDEVYISQTSGTGFQLFDTERVEILRGPQGTLFGRNATGGLAHFITRKPSQEADGYAKVTYGAFDQFKAEAAVGGPLSDTLSGRISFSHHQNDGYVENVFLPVDERETLNNADDQAWRVQLLWEPTDTFSLLLNHRGSKSDIRTGFWEGVVSVDGVAVGGDAPNPVAPAPFGGVQPGPGYVESDRNTDPFSGSFGEPGFNELETRGYTGTIEWDLGWGTVTSITDFSTVDRNYLEDAEASPFFLNNFFLTTDSDQISQETRIAGESDRLRWVAGLYYLDLELSDSNGIITEFYAEDTIAGFATPTPTTGGVFNPYTRDLRSISGFGQVDYDLTDTLTVTAGLRVINDKQDFEYFGLLADFPRFTPGTGLSAANRDYFDEINTITNLVLADTGEESLRFSRNDTEVAFKVGVEWAPDPDSLYFFNFNRGVKSGGFNAPIFPFAAPGLGYDTDTIVFDPEQLDAYEVGFKKSFLDGDLLVNASAYYYDYANYQAFEAVELDTLTRNAQAESYGGELEIIATPGEGWDIVAGYSFNENEVELETGFITRSVQTPKHNFNALVRKGIPVGGGELAIQADVDYRSEVFFALQPSPVVTQGGYALVNALVAFTPESEQWTLSANVSNLTDKEYLVQALDFAAFLGVTEEYYGRPRWWSVSFKYNW